MGRRNGPGNDGWGSERGLPEPDGYGYGQHHDPELLSSGAPRMVGQVLGQGDGRGAPPAGSEFRRYWQVIRNRRVVFGTVFAVVMIGVGVGTYFQDPVYRASGTIEVRKQGADVMPVEALFELSRISDQHMQTQFALLRSPALARRVVTELGLADVDEFTSGSLMGSLFALFPSPSRGSGADPAAGAGAGVPPVDTRTQAAVDRFLERLTVAPVDNSRLIRVTFEARDPELAARVVNSVFTSYMTLRGDAHKEAVARLAEQADSVRSKLAASERRLQDFVRDNELLLAEIPEGGGGSLLDDRLRQLQDQLTVAEAERYALEARNAEILRGGGQIVNSAVAQTLSVPLAEMEAEYARLRTTFTDDFPRVIQLRRQITALREQLDGERSRMSSEIAGDYRAVTQRVAMLRQAFQEQRDLAERLGDQSAEYGILKRDAEGHEQLYALLQQREKEADVSAAMALTETAVVDAAIAPLGPVRPSPRQNLSLAAFAGMLLAIGAALLREYTDPRVRRVEELDGLEVPILALIPSARSELRLAKRAWGSARALPGTGGGALTRGEKVPQGGPWVRIDRDDWRRSALAEGFGNLRTSVLFSGGSDLAARSLLVTSVQAGEGKTMVSMNLAISLAKLGRRVLLIDADMRRPSLHRAFGLRESPGLSDALMGGEDWRTMTAEVGVPNLRLLAAGSPSDVPAELLSSERMETLMEEVEAEHEFVVIDSPALMVNVADARILTSLADGIVLVVRGGVTPRDVLRRLVGRTPNVVGVVLNDLDAAQLPDYYGDYRSTRNAGSGVGTGSGAGAKGRNEHGGGDAPPRLASGEG